MLFLSCVPWFAFTGVTHAVDARSQDSIPRISWGRLVEREGRSILPMNFQLHHGLADGLHVAKFMAAFEANLQAQS
jgi:chloramphenicol O-acetyltransferase type A